MLGGGGGGRGGGGRGGDGEVLGDEGGSEVTEVDTHTQPITSINTSTSGRQQRPGIDFTSEYSV